MGKWTENSNFVTFLGYPISIFYRTFGKQNILSKFLPQELVKVLQLKNKNRQNILAKIFKFNIKFWTIEKLSFIFRIDQRMSLIETIIAYIQLHSKMPYTT